MKKSILEDREKCKKCKKHPWVMYGYCGYCYIKEIQKAYEQTKNSTLKFP